MKKKNIEKKKNFTLVLCVLISALFPLGIVATVLGAVKEKILIMVLGLVFLVGSFFSLPFVWLVFGSLVTKSRIYKSITQKGITDVNTLAKIHAKNPSEITQIINWLIAKGYLNYTLLYDKIEKELVETSVKCPNCGAILKESKNNLICEYCQSKFEKN